MIESFEQALTDRDLDPVLFDKVDDQHEELSIVNFVLDTDSNHVISMNTVYYIGVLHVFLIEFSQNDTGCLT